MLQRILKNKDGIKCGVIVNDLASVNVDANIVGRDVKVCKPSSCPLLAAGLPCLERPCRAHASS